MSIPVVADADTLFAATTRGLLIYLDYQGLIKLHWSPLILDEVNRALVDTGRKKTLKEAKAHEARMCDALPDALVSVADVQAQFEAVASAVRSAKDTHVAACAHYLIAAKAYPDTSAVALVSHNTKDFKKAVLAGLGIALQKPDAFLHGLTVAQPVEVAATFRRFRLDLSSKPEPQALLERLERDGQVKTAQRLRELHLARTVEL
ncbi:PIN domain-containing protein [Pollutimonas bauzanensis]|uniref:PIN domain-containing protein n=1 Tax=Pollutimonas bauzanensis TaxID=658167 RepID=A0A1M5YDX0_9BURK|nr:PIN domain-containing protein [Pollutimonas bauzanensis]SHI10227.1 PIN domain-containing protein [Pollutimonas bauzanensis]